jgi:hypothetical protein
LSTVSFLTLGLIVACAEPAQEGDLPLEDGEGDLAKADATSLVLTELVGLADGPRLDKGGKAILTSKKAWQSYFGTKAPAEIDFSREWVAFYGSGLHNTGGFSAQITGIRYDAAQRQLILETLHTSPGFDCIVTQAFTTPHTLVKFAIPSPRPTFAVSQHRDEERRCSPTPEELQAELAASRAAFENANAEHGNSYTYDRESFSVFGPSSRTTIVVDAGVVVERHFKSQVGANTTVWSEIGDEVGSHGDQGHPAVLLDALYDECANDVLTRNPDENFLDLSFHQDGLLQVCTYFPRNCADDCSQGPVITSIEMK